MPSPTMAGMRSSSKMLSLMPSRTQRSSQLTRRQIQAIDIATPIAFSFALIDKFRCVRSRDPARDIHIQDRVEILGRDRLGEIAVHPCRQASLLIAFHGVSGQGDHRLVEPVPFFLLFFPE